MSGVINLNVKQEESSSSSGLSGRRLFFPRQGRPEAHSLAHSHSNILLPDGCQQFHFPREYSTAAVKPAFPFCCCCCCFPFWCDPDGHVPVFSSRGRCLQNLSVPREPSDWSSAVFAKLLCENVVLIKMATSQKITSTFLRQLTTGHLKKQPTCH